jgi:DNA mismatch repair protein MutS
MSANVQLDHWTRRSLELVRSASNIEDTTKNTLLSRLLPIVHTPGGRRLLRTRLSSPITDLIELKQRHDAIEYFQLSTQPLIANTRHDITVQLKNAVTDMERAVQRLSVKNGGPRDLIAIESSLSAAKEIGTILTAYDKATGTQTATPALLQKVKTHLSTPELDELIRQIRAAIIDDPPNDPYVRVLLSSLLSPIRTDWTGRVVVLCM